MQFLLSEFPNQFFFKVHDKKLHINLVSICKNEEECRFGSKKMLGFTQGGFGKCIY